MYYLNGLKSSKQLKMGNRKTEEERIERVIRSLLKLPENRRCINCNLLGPQYVCTTFSTFVCTNCSGIHREFTHRVKSVSMAKFSPEEVTALQAGGNERAKQIYFKEWNPLRHSHPESGNIHKLRDFIKHVYVERRYSGENCGSSLPRIKMSEKEESYASKKSSSFRFEIISPHSCPGASSDDKNLRFLYDESRSPRYTQKYSRNAGLTKSPIKIEVVDDRFRDKEHRNRRLSNIESKLKQISIDDQKNVDKSQLPVARPSGEILREKASSLQVSHSGGKGSVEENPSEQKNNNPERSINLSTKSQPTNSVAGGGPESPPHITQSNENNWAIFGASTENKDPKSPNTNTSKPSTTNAASEAATPAKNPLDLLLFELSGPVTPVTGEMSQAASGTNNDPTTTTVDNANIWDFPPTSVGKTGPSPNNTSVWSSTLTPATESAQPSNEVLPHSEVSHAHKPSSMHYLPSVSSGCSKTTPLINSPVKDVASNNQPSVAPSTNDSLWALTEQSPQTTSSMQCLPPVPAGCSSTTQPKNSQVKDVSSNNHLPVAPSTNNSSWGFTELSSQATSKPTQETKPDAGSQLSKVETRSSGRMELPEDLFTSSYLSGPASLAGWQNVQPYGMGYGMQYYQNAAPPSALPNAPKYSNPFDVTDGRSLMHVSSLPTMESSHGVPPPAVSPRTGLMHASSSLGSLGTMVSQSPCYASPVPLAEYQVNNKEQPTRPRRAGSLHSELSAFGSLDPIQQYNRELMTSKTANSFSNTRGNPFD
ncbi:putative ADP-ribosylation factor GTPase-activating protein AGD14 [Glycine max]|nr:putative ADP-ribosylation factor GTPase-activating protein AGD14 [Glycine max]